MGNKNSHGRRRPLKQHARLGQVMRNNVCPYCACRITKITWTKEHMLPVGLTDARPYDFMACQKCNNKKSALDDVASTVLRFSTATPHFQAGFNKMVNSPEGRKSLDAILRHFNLDTGRKLSDEGNWGVEGDDKTTIVFLEWLKWIARGLYFLETERCLKPKEKHRTGYYFVHSLMLNPGEMAALRNGEISDAKERFARIDRWRHRPETQTFGEGSVYLWCESIRRTGAFISLGGWYTFVVKVSPYSKKAFLDTATQELRYFGSPDLRGRVAVDVKREKGKEKLILE